MKILIIIVAFFAATAHAKTETKVSLKHSKFQVESPSIQPSFDADSELGRAWVVLSLEDSNQEDTLTQRENIRVKMDGLSLDPATGNIVYERNDEKTICATPHSRILGRTKYFKSSKNCNINVSLVTIKEDDGFALIKSRVANVVLDTAKK